MFEINQQQQVNHGNKNFTKNLMPNLISISTVSSNGGYSNRQKNQEAAAFENVTKLSITNDVTKDHHNLTTNKYYDLPDLSRIFNIENDYSNCGCRCERNPITFDNYGVYNRNSNVIFRNKSLPVPSIDRKMTKQLSFLNYQNYLAKLNLNSEPSNRNGNHRRKKNPLRKRLMFLRDLSPPTESLLSSGLQILIATLVVCLANIVTGKIVQDAQDNVFGSVDALYAMIPILLGLKNIVEMSMVARISTEINIGNFQQLSLETVAMLGSDLALVLYQSTALSLSASIFSMILIDQEHLSYDKYCLVVASTLLASSLSCLILGILISLIVIGIHKLSLDPDNFAAPLAIALGDMLTALIFKQVSNWLYQFPSSSQIASLIVVLFIGAILPISYWIANRNSYTRRLVHSGWISLFVSMIIFSCSGHFLHETSRQFVQAPTFEPIVCGMARNLISIATSKLSTSLHLNSKLGHLPEQIKQLPIKLSLVFFNQKDPNSGLWLFLSALSIPIQALNLYILTILLNGQLFSQISLSFGSILIYLLLIQAQIILMLYISYNMVHFFWLHRINPDNVAIPILLSLSDMSGIFSIVIIFKLFRLLGEPLANR